MPRRAGIAVAVILVLVVLVLLNRCGGGKLLPGPPDEPAAEKSIAPPPVVDDESPEVGSELDAPAAMVRRSGRFIHDGGEAARGYRVYVTGPGIVRQLEALRKAGDKEVVAGDLRAMRLEDGLLPPAWRVGRTDKEGRFEVTWSADIVGRVDLVFAYEDADGEIRIRHRIEKADAGVPNEIRPKKTGAIEGQVRTPDGQAVEKALVYCLPLDVLVPTEATIFSRRATPFTGLFLVQWARHARTDRDGRYRIGGLRPAPYRVFARRADRGGEIHRIDIVSGKPNADRDIVLSIEGAYVRGLVADGKTSNPIPGCLIAADDPQGTTMSNPDGTYRIGPMAPGEFRGFVLKTDYEPSPLGPFELVAGRTYAAPTTYMTPTKK